MSGLLSAQVWLNNAPSKIPLVFEFLQRSEAEYLFEEIFVRDEYLKVCKFNIFFLFFSPAHIIFSHSITCIQHGVTLPLPRQQPHTYSLRSSPTTIQPKAKRPRHEPNVHKYLVLDIGSNIGRARKLTSNSLLHLLFKRVGGDPRYPSKTKQRSVRTESKLRR